MIPSPNNKPRPVKSFVIRNWDKIGAVLIFPEDGEVFIGIPAEYYCDGEGPFIEIKRDGNLVSTVNCRHLATVNFPDNKPKGTS